MKKRKWRVDLFKNKILTWIILDSKYRNEKEKWETKTKIMRFFFLLNNYDVGVSV